MRAREAVANANELLDGNSMAHAIHARLDWLTARQNRDGGWPYRAGLRSWTEPSAWALLAIAAADKSSPAVARARDHLISLQNNDGSWPASAGVRDSHWVTSLVVSAGLRVGFPNQTISRALNWLIYNRGTESGMLARIGGLLGPDAVALDRRWSGWSWTPGTSSWIEPTSHAMIALSAVRRSFGSQYASSGELELRIDSARRMLLDRMCVDGGWNYGNRRVLGMDLPGYAQTTGVALIALREERQELLARSIAFAMRMYGAADVGRLGRAWLGLALACHGHAVPFAAGNLEYDLANDVVLNSLELIALAGGQAA